MNALLLVSSIAIGVAGPSEGHDHHSPQLGTLAFETSCTDPARTRLVEGLGWLHSFEYAEAARSFN